MPNYRRQRAAGGIFFFTVAIANRESRLLTANIGALRIAFDEAKHALPFSIDAIVVLPEHLHCVWTLPDNDRDFSSRWQIVKSRFSRQLASSESRSVSRLTRRERGVWQRRFWEHCIRDDADYEAHLDYIHFNPVKHGHVRAVADWPYSSFHRFVRSAVYPLNWASDSPPEGQFGER